MCSGRSRANCRVMTVLWTTKCRSTSPLERRFVDLSGKMPSSAGWAQYRTMTGDKFSPMGWPYFVKRKSDAKMAFARFLTDINAPGVLSTVQFLLSDNGIVFTKPELVEMLNPPGIRREYTNVASPEHDGLVERRISMMLELAMVSRLVDTRLFDESKLLLTGFLLAEALQVRLRRTKHDGQDHGQGGHVLSVSEVFPQGAVCTASEAWFSPRQ